MIFKRWFKPKWQHADAAVRLQAIAELEASGPENKKILHELAFNDGSEQVRRAALEQLNDFSLWWQASKHDPAERLKQHAEQQLINMLLENQVSSVLKQQFINQCQRSSILEQLALTEKDAVIKMSLLQRLDKPDLLLKTLPQDTVLSVSQKQQLLNGLNDEKLLEKLHRQLSGELQQWVQQKRVALEELKQQPARLRKQLTLLLAKLNALRERRDIADIPELLKHYRQEWHDAEPSLSSLGAEAEVFSDKYHKLIKQLEGWLAPRLEALQQQQAQQLADAARAAHYQQIHRQLTDLQKNLAEALLQADLAAAETLSQQLQQIRLQLDSSTDKDLAQQRSLEQHLFRLEQQLTTLPQTAEKLAAATRMLTEWGGQPLPETAEAYQQVLPQYQQWRDNWKSLTGNLDIELPESLQQSYRALAGAWRKAAGEFKASAEKGFKLCRNKLAEFRRQYQAGKFKVLFGLFKSIEEDYQRLPAQQQQQLSKEFQEASEKLAELTDWQEYIATPRKQQLVEQLQQLAASAPSDPVARASAVKQAREQWKTLGKAEVGLDAQLNAAFDQACEAAFEPCREYFARQDAEREANANARLELINRLLQLAGQPDSAALESEVTRLTQAWQQAGAVDKNRYTVLLEQYQNALKPLKQRLHQLHQQSADAKQALIDNAVAAQQLEDAAVAAKLLKEYQQQWKTLGFAGKGRDQALWQQFRQQCDSFFNARHEQLRQQQQTEQAQQLVVQQQLQQLQEAVEQAAALSELSVLSQQLNTLFSEVPRGQQQPLKQLSDQIKQKQQQLQHQQQQSELLAVFDVLKQGESVRAEQLPVIYREVFAQQQEQNMNRQQLTLALEIICQQPSPDTESGMRQQVQLLLLSDKHNQGETLSREALFRRWLQFGVVKEAEKTLLERARKAFSA